MIEKNGRITYSNIAVILNAAKRFDLISITSNPVVGGSFTLNVSAAQNLQMEMVITDIQGRILQKQKINVIAGFNTVPVNVSKLAKGVYMIRANNGGTAITSKFVKE